MVRKFISKIHLWLGLASGVIIFIISITGCIYVFSREITEMRRANAIRIEKSDSTPLAVSQLWNTVQKEIGPEKKINWANIYNDPEKSWIFYSYKADMTAPTYFSTIQYYQSIFIDPYTGKIKGIYDEKSDFFNIVKYIHWSLLLNTSIGQPIIGWSTFIFVVTLISGLILWWPKKLKHAKNTLSFKWNSNTRGIKKIYDLHNILGFYVLLVSLLIATTGMVWAFKWFQAIVYVAASGTTTPPDRSSEKSVPGGQSTTIPLDDAVRIAREKYTEAAGVRISPATDSLDVIHIYIQHKAGLYYKTSELQFDQYSGKLLKERKHEEKNAGEKLITANYDIHVGAILGIPGKIIAFLASLICASLPVTGFLMWWIRRRKQRAPLL